MNLETLRDYITEPDTARRRELAGRLRRSRRAHVPCASSADLERLMQRPIAAGGSVAGWKALPSRKNPEPLVPLGPFAGVLDSRHFPAAVNAIYFEEDPAYPNFLGHPVDRGATLLAHFARREVAARLGAAAELLSRAGMYFLFFDTFRPLAVQGALFTAFRERLSRERPDLAAEALDREAQKYVSLPAPDAQRQLIHASPHSTGAAVDLSIITLAPEGRELLSALAPGREVSFSLPRYYIEDIRARLSAGAAAPSVGDLVRQFEEHWEPHLFRELAQCAIFRIYGDELEMGTPFDHFGESAATDYFEKRGGSHDALRNRRLLHNLLVDHGFQNYEEEWWHYSFGDGMAARKQGLDSSEYHCAEFAPEHVAFETIRRAIWEALPAVPCRYSF